MSGASAWLDRHGGRDLTSVAIAPDLGERYLGTVHSPAWSANPHQAGGTLGSGDLAALPRPA